MTQRRGLGRGLGALIPGAGATAPRGTDQDPELRTRRTVEPEDRGGSAPAQSGPRPVDMFFSGDPLPETAESRSRRLAGGADLAGAMARAAAERRAATRTPARRRGSAPAGEESAERTAAADAGTPEEPAKRSSRSGASSSRSSRSGAAKTSAGTATSAKSGSSKSASSKTASSKTSSSKSASSKSASSRPASSTAASSKAASSTAASSKTASSTPASSTPSTADPSAAPASAAVSSTEAVAAEQSSAVSADAAPTAPVGTAPAAPEPAAPVAAGAAQDAPAAAPEERVEDNPVVDVEKVELTPAHPVPAAAQEPASEPDPAPEQAEVPERTPEAEEDQESLHAPAAVDAGAAAPTAEPAAAADDPAEARPEAPAAASTATDEETPAQQTAADEPEGLVRVPGAEFAEIPIHEIRENPRNPRTMFDDDALDELAFSLREVGVLQPVVVRSIPVTEDGESFELVMGERRWRAAQRAGLTSIPAIIRETSDDDLLRDALLENLHRTQLNPLEEAAAYQQLLDDFGCTQDELSARIGRSRPQISNTLRLMRLPPLVQRRLASGALSAGHARALLALEDPRLMEELAGRIVAEGLSVRAVERLVARGPESSGTKSTTPRRTTYNPRVVDITSRLSNRLEAPVRIDVGKRKGRITLEFTNLDDLERLVERLGIEQEEPAGSVD